MDFWSRLDNFRIYLRLSHLLSFLRSQHQTGHNDLHKYFIVYIAQLYIYIIRLCKSTITFLGFNYLVILFCVGSVRARAGAGGFGIGMKGLTDY